MDKHNCYISKIFDFFGRFANLFPQKTHFSRKESITQSKFHSPTAYWVLHAETTIARDKEKGELKQSSASS